MTADNKNLERVFQGAIEHWWRSKESNAAQVISSQGGTRDQCLRGDTMDGFRDAIISRLVSEGVKKEDIYFGGQLSALASNLPSYYRASKNWDVVVCKNAHHLRLENPNLPEPVLVAAVEFKSQNKSIGNNQNNRIEESIGNAYDFWASYENRNFVHLTPRPWLGYLFVGRYAKGDEKAGVVITQPLFPTDPAFIYQDEKNRLTAQKISGISYAERYKIFLERMIAKKLYDGACFLVTEEEIIGESPNYRVLYPELSGQRFLDNLCRYIRAYYFD